MENTSTHFECEIDNLGYTTIEGEISRYFDMGSPDNSNIPPQMREDSSETCIFVCARKSGNFRITNFRLNSGNYLLQVTLIGKLNKS